MTHKTLTLLADKLTNIEIDCGQVTCQLHGVSIEAICNQITAQDVAETMPTFDLISALVDIHGAEEVQRMVLDCSEEK